MKGDILIEMFLHGDNPADIARKLSITQAQARNVIVRWCEEAYGDPPAEIDSERYTGAVILRGRLWMLTLAGRKKPILSRAPHKRAWRSVIRRFLKTGRRANQIERPAYYGA